MISTARPEWPIWFMRLAYVTAQRASCPRKHVGALIVDPHHRVVAGGYNGAPRGQPDCLTVGCDLREIQDATGNLRKSCVRTLHAESNAIDYAGREARGCSLYTTVVPCRPCAQRIIQAGIEHVVYHEYYVSQGTAEVEELFKGAGVKLFHLDVPLAVVDGFYKDPS